MNYLFIDVIVTVTFISTYMLLLWVATLSNPIEIYFGNILGPKCNSNMITQTVSNKFFKSYCMSLNGSQLWDYQSKMMETVYVSWCKSVCRILVVPPTTTRCEYLLYIVDDQDIKILYDSLNLYNHHISHQMLIYVLSYQVVDQILLIIYISIVCKNLGRT